MIDKKKTVTGIMMKNQYRLEPNKVKILKLMPNTSEQHHKGRIKHSPYLGSIVTVKNHNHMEFFTVASFGVEKKLNPDLRPLPIYQYTSQILKPSVKKQFRKILKKHNVAYPLVLKHNKRERQERDIFTNKHLLESHGYSTSDRVSDRNSLKSMNYVEVIGGFHIGIAPASKTISKEHPFINTKKPYYFKVDQGTKFISRCKKNTIAQVLTAKGTRWVVINKVIRARGREARIGARGLKPVIRFTGKKIRNSWIKDIYEYTMEKA